MPAIMIICGAGIVSGKEMMALELGDGLAQKGHSVTYVVSYWSNGDFAERLRRRGHRALVLAIGFISATLTLRCLAMTIEQLWRWPGLVWGYFRLLEELRPGTVVHTNWQHMLLLAPFLRREREMQRHAWRKHQRQRNTRRRPLPR